MTELDSERPGLRERKKRRTRAALREAAVELSLPEGPDAVTVEAICARADVSPRTFFNYFAVKDEAIVGWDDEDGARLVAAVTARPADEDPLTALEAVLADLVDDATTTPLWRDQLALLRRFPSLALRFATASHRLEQSVTAATAERAGRPADDPDVAVVAAASAAALRVAIGRWVHGPAGTDGRALLAEAIAVLRRGLTL